MFTNFAVLGSGETTDLSSFIDTVTAPIKSAFTMANLGTIITAGLSIALIFVLGWFGFRWIYSKAKGGLKKGV